MPDPTAGPLALPLSQKARRTVEQPISYLINAVMANPQIINLAAGLVDPLTLPVEECARISRKLFADPERARAALQYDTTQGLSALRERMLAHVEAQEHKSAAAMGLSAANVIVTTGSQQALYLLGDALIDPGDIVIAEQPSYFVYTGALSSLGARVVTAPMDQDGMDVEGVAKALEKISRAGELSRVKLVYCTSYYQNPTGLTLSRERRPRLLEIVKRFSTHHRIILLEDAAYRELRYDGDALPSIKSFDADNRFTVLSQTFSKPFAPGLKLGYTLMPDDLLEAVLHQKGNHDFGSSSLAQHLALEAVCDGSYAHHVTVLCDAYRAKRDAMLDALQRRLPQHPEINWTHPHGGLYVWVTLPQQLDTSREGKLFQSCLAEGVIYVPGVYCSQTDDVSGQTPRHQLRLSFGQVAMEQIIPGIERLARAIQHALSGSDGIASPAPTLAGAAR